MKSAIILFLLGTVCFADTIVGRDSGEVNGRVIYADGVFTINAKVNGTAKTYTIQRDDVSEVSFNNREDNRKTPPWINEDEGRLPPQAVYRRRTTDSARKRDTLYLVNGQMKSGELKSIGASDIMLKSGNSVTSTKTHDAIKIVLQ